jgi:hypothetical protein
MSLPWADFNLEDACPSCGAYVNGTTNTENLSPPEPGDRAVCVYCHSINVYGDDLKQRLPTESEAMEHAMNPKLQELVWAMRMLGPPPSRRQ